MTAATGRPNGNDSADDRRRELRETISWCSSAGWTP